MNNVIKHLRGVQVWKNYVNNDEVFKINKSFQFRYDCYSFKIIRTERGLIGISVSPRLEVFNTRGLAFEGEITVDFTIVGHTGTGILERPLENHIAECLEKSNEEFLDYFDSMEGVGILKKFRPTFIEDGLIEQIRLSLQQTFD